MRSASLLILAAWMTTECRPASAQFVRPPIVVPRPPVPIVHPHVPVPHGTTGAQQGGGWDESAWWLIGGGATAVAGVGAGAYIVHRLRKRAIPRAVVRISATPPGEAPEQFRQAWVGLLLPLIEGQVQSEYTVAQQAVSHTPVTAPSAYAVEGKVAVDILASANPEAAAWWRQNVPEILAAGYQLIFPAEVCERLDDLGA